MQLTVVCMCVCERAPPGISQQIIPAAPSWLQVEPELFSDKDAAPSEFYQLHAYSSEALLGVITNSDGSDSNIHTYIHNFQREMREQEQHYFSCEELKQLVPVRCLQIAFIKGFTFMLSSSHMEWRTSLNTHTCLIDAKLNVGMNSLFGREGDGLELDSIGCQFYSFCNKTSLKWKYTF